MSAETSGLALIEVNVAEGDKVAKGQLIARLNDSLPKAAVAEQQAAVSQAEANVAAAMIVEKRARTLVATNAVSQETADTAAATLKTDQALLDQAKAALDGLNVQLARTQIFSPVAGMVSQPPAVVGTVVQTGTELFHIVRDGRIEVDAKVPEQYLAAIADGQPVQVTDAAGATIAGTVRGIAAEVDSTTRLGIVYVALPADAALRPGMFARTLISTESKTALTVPLSAITWQDGKATVFILGTDNAVSLRSVEVGARAGDLIAVTSGLAASETIVTSGAGFLNDGNTVRVASAEIGATAVEKAVAQ